MKSKKRAKPKTKSERSGLMFPVGRINRILRHGNFAPRVGSGASIYLAAVLEYLAAEILELAGNAAKENGKSRITPRHILLAIRNDDELDLLLSDVTISTGGVLPHIQPQLLPRKTLREHQKSQQQNTSSQEY
ncbi:histone H2A-beta, sperm-like isoform X2 [Plutella xylostella]|uniref:histone H2A-beta, sperm-like isoform X2 n=1 Tax=Plutella xylostella TaxID=51655 RepID=UPI0018D1A680|nr:histone H2A-beta, sperm-like isoform X2 [Plutella xylostella]